MQVKDYTDNLSVNKQEYSDPQGEYSNTIGKNDRQHPLRESLGDKSIRTELLSKVSVSGMKADERVKREASGSEDCISNKSNEMLKNMVLST